MNSITKERIELFIKNPLDNGLTRGEQMELARIALASLEAEPVAECIIEDGGMCVDGFGEYVGHSLPDGTHQLYAVPPMRLPDGLEAAAVAWKVVFTQVDQESNTFTAMYSDKAEVERWVRLHEVADFRADITPLYTAKPVAVIPDGWISCSERMPKKNQNVLISVNFDSDLVEPLICSARNTGSTFRRGQATIKPGNGIEQATHWMPLPEPPQQDGK
ncbi:DUF551 domain-containing protein [Escherichia coli]|nr:DUF551 domain-containing protein [Escherichia coli]